MPIDPLESSLPGADLVKQGLADLKGGRVSDFALLLLAAGPSLRNVGLDIPERSTDRPYHHLLYERQEDRLGEGAHSYYNSLMRRIVSYTRALEREQKSA